MAVPAASPVPLWQPEPGGGVTPPGERQLLAAVERLARAPQGWAAVALHLSRLAPPGPRPHHHRIARATLQEAAQRNEGQVFVLRNGDLVLLSRDDAPPAATLAERLRALFGREAGGPDAIVSDWKLPHAGAVLLAYTIGRLGDPETPVAEDPAPPPAGIVDRIVEAIGGARPHDLVQRQSAVMLDPASGALGMTMRVAYRELSFSLDALEDRAAAASRLGHDHALLMHLRRYLDQRMLQVLRLDHGSLGPLDPTAGGAPALHLNLSLPGALSDDFAALATLCRIEHMPLAVELSLVEAIADAEAFLRARERLRELGVRLVLDGVSHLAMLLMRPAALRADLLKLEWSPRVAELAAGERADLARAIADADPARVILQRAESETAVRWGMAQRIRLFQGRHIDQMLAVQRMLACPGAGACALRQCVERARVAGGERRVACTNLTLLDAGLPAVVTAGGKA